MAFQALLSVAFLMAFIANVFAQNVQPLVTKVTWGSLCVGEKQFKDVRIWPNHSEEWDWRKTGTLHNPDIQIADLSDFIERVDVIVLTQGFDGVLQVMPKTINYIKSLGKELIVARTPQAVEQYNKLALKGKRVGALLHSTC